MKEGLNRHESMRGYFAHELHAQMSENADIWVVTADLGYGMMDSIKRDYPDRFVNVGAAEQAGIGVSCGLALKGKTPFFYSITNFTLYRPYEWLRNYVNHEKIGVKLIGAGRDNDYAHDGWTHQSPDAKQVLATLPNIAQFFPETKDEASGMVREMIELEGPAFISLKR